MCGGRVAHTAMMKLPSTLLQTVYQWCMRLVTDMFLCSFTRALWICSVSGKLRSQYTLKDCYLSHIKLINYKTELIVINHLFKFRNAASVFLCLYRCEARLHVTEKNPEQTIQSRKWEIIKVKVGYITAWTNHPRLSLTE